ncbi:Carboxy-terminal domain (CTD) phosphatase [Geranomyces michiganensis]|nr:Carboxy-terminal domain (CTD) phosphatase [Geranomyces michiganensis]
MESRQNLTLPASRYPITIISLRIKKGDKLVKDEVIGVYEHLGTVSVKRKVDRADGSVITEDVPTQRLVREQWRSQFQGTVEALNVKPGMVISDPKQVLMVVLEPCGHPVQVKGICATCGKDLTMGDYMGTNDMKRATINMAHDNRGVTVSHDMASQLQKEQSQRLVAAEKLILILDLDQTVVHATTDPTVPLWMNDPQNPNHPFLTDVHMFDIPHYQTHYIKLR